MRARVALALVCAGCGGPAWASATEPPSGARRPDGVTLEPPASMPVAVRSADARGVVALRAPVADEAIERVVWAFVRAFDREDEAALAALLADEAWSLERGGGTRPQLLDQWRRQRQSPSFAQLEALARVAKLERYEHETLGERGAPSRPHAMRADDVLVRVPLGEGEAEALLLLLRQEGGELKIAGQGFAGDAQR